jgi:hypothetical protein
MKRYIKIEWENNTDLSLPRIMGRDDNIDEDELIMIIEAKAGDRVKKIYPYQPKPKYILLYAGTVFHGTGYAPSLILHISPTRNQEMEDSLACVKCFGIFEEAEMIYDIVRFTCYDVATEVNGDTLYFEENKLNSKGEMCSIMQILIGIFQAVTSTVYEKSYLNSHMSQLKEVWEN